MKQKRNLKYPLILGVTLVWGMIIYKVVNGLGNNDTFKPLTASATKINYLQVADSFTLIDNYPDPFIPKEETGKKESIKQPDTPLFASENAIAPKVLPKPAFDPSVIQYRGMISNPENKIQVAILNISGGEYLVKLNEIVSNCKIRRIEKDRIVIVYKGHSFTIERSK